MIENENQLANTVRKLALLEEQIAASLREPQTPERDVSVQSLQSLARQMNEEIVRYRSKVKLRDAG
jgi:hypothetical protein